MRRRLSVLICGAFLGLGGPSLASAAETENQAAADSGETAAAASASEEPAATSAASASEEPAATSAASAHEESPATATPKTNEQPDKHGPPTGGPEQKTSSDSDADVSNDAKVDQGSDQAQNGGDTAGDTRPAEASNGAGQGNQEAGTSQQVQADAAASSENGRNEADHVHAGQGGGRGAVEQRSETGAAASAHAKDKTGQQGAEAAGSNDRQSADASADALSSDSSNTLLDARIGAPGNDDGFDQSVHAGAAAQAEIEGPDGAQQEARAEARAEAENARNTAVELRIDSDGDSAGGSQTIAADASATATGSSADADATAALINPFNTFVSIRVNSDGTTGPVSQTVSAQESETVNGGASERQLEEAGVSSWDFDANGIVIRFTSDGSNTDVRISVDDVTLHRPDEAPLFVWEWNMVFGAGSRPDCAITSSLDAVRVLWQFDCDPEDRLAQTASTSATAAAPTNALSWAWNWLRPQLTGWSWERNDLVLLPACGTTCAFLFDFHWLSLEPTEAPTAPTAAVEASPSAVAAVEQLNEVLATATASAESTIEQILIQSGGEQTALQEASVTQFVTAQAAAGLADVRNVAVGTGQQARQTNRAASEATTAADAEIVQLLAQTQSGEDSFQTQAALQTASASQKIHSGSNSTVAHSSNWDVSLGGTSTQASTSSAAATGALTASSWQVIEQEQQGNSSDQLQIAGQLAVTVQEMEILAAAGVADARISSRLNRDSSSLGVSSAVAGSGTSRSEVNQLSLQFQSGDEVAEQQESYQTVSVAQTGSTLAAASAGGTLRYFFIPPAATFLAEPASPLEAALESLTPVSAELSFVPEPSFVPVGGIRPAFKTRKLAPSVLRPFLTPLHPIPIFSREQAAAPAAPFASPTFTDSVSRAGYTGSAPKRAKDTERASGRSPRGLCLASCSSGASAASAGTGSFGGAFLASPMYALSPASALGRWQTAPAGRRPAAVVLLRAKPG